MNLHVSIHCDSCAGWIATKFTIVWYLSTVGQSETLDWPQEYGFSPVWVKIWSLKTWSELKTLSHCRHLCNFFPMCAIWCFFKFPAWLNPFSQWWHLFGFCGSGSDWANGPPPYPWISFSARFCLKVQLWRRLYREGCHPKVSMNHSFWLYFWYIQTTFWLQYGYILPTC